jgi:hypothetical protein
MTRADIATRLASIEGFYPHEECDHHVLCGRSGHTGLAIWFPHMPDIARLAGETAGALALASHLPFGISAHVPIIGQCQPAHVLALHDQVRVRPSLIQQLATPLILAQLAADGSLHIHNDSRGVAELYQHGNAEGLQVWSNRLAMPLVFAGSEPVESVEGAQLRAVYGYYPHEHTPFANVQRVLGGGTVFAGDWPSAPIVNRHNHLVEMLGGAYAEQGKPVDYAACRTSLISMLIELNLFWTGPLHCRLTGGHDARTILASLIATGQTARLVVPTINLLGQDDTATEQIMVACRSRSIEFDWQRVELKPGGYQKQNNDKAFTAFPAAAAMRKPVLETVSRWFGTIAPRRSHDYAYKDNPLLDRLVFHFHRMDGQMLPCDYHRGPARDHANTRAPMHLGDHAGETLRAVHYSADDLKSDANDFARRRVDTLFPIRQAEHGSFNPERPFPSAVLHRAAGAWERYMDDAKASGIGSFLVFDYLNTVAEQSRRGDVAQHLRQTCLLAHPLLVQESFKLTPEQRLNNAMHMGLIGVLAPFLLDIPFAAARLNGSSEVRPTITGKPQLWDSDAIPGWAGILADQDAWSDVFDAPTISRVLGVGDATSLNTDQRETLGGLLAWRTAQRAYCTILSTYIRDQRNRSAHVAA